MEHYLQRFAISFCSLSNFFPPGLGSLAFGYSAPITTPTHLLSHVCSVATCCFFSLCLHFGSSIQTFYLVSCFLIYLLIGRKLLYNIVLISAVQQCKLVIIIYIYFLPPLPHHRISLGHHRVPGWTPSVTLQLPTSYLFYT